MEAFHDLLSTSCQPPLRFSPSWSALRPRIGQSNEGYKVDPVTGHRIFRLGMRNRRWLRWSFNVELTAQLHSPGESRTAIIICRCMSRSFRGSE